MTISLQTVNTAIHTRQFWLDRTNDIINVVSNNAVTTNSNTAVGNAAISGTFTANVIVSNNITLSNGGSIGPLNINSTSASVNTAFTANEIITPILTTNNSVLSTLKVQTTGTTTQILDSFLLSTYRTGEYTLSVKDNTANNYVSSKVLIMHDGTNAYSTEYGIALSNTAIGIVSSTANSTHAILLYTPVSSNTTINIIKHLLVV